MAISVLVSCNMHVSVSSLYAHLLTTFEGWISCTKSPHVLLTLEVLEAESLSWRGTTTLESLLLLNQHAKYDDC